MFLTINHLCFRDGNLPDISRAGSLHEFLMDLHKKYGSIASFWMGKQLVASIASPELFKEHLNVFDRPRKFYMGVWKMISF